jgi:Ca2+/H+ antiporter, TMEM165/GDT1 family
MAGFWAALFFIFAAEMGDKTQLVALSFATRFKPWKVITGVFLATLVIHLLSVFIGRETSSFIPLYYVKILVGLSFIGFGVWTLRGDSYDEAQKKPGRFGQLATVAIAFFLAELGDKTQLATISLAAQYNSFIGVWLGSTLGMVAADGLAIIVGIVAGRKLPERLIRIISAAIFIGFGVYTLAALV